MMCMYIYGNYIFNILSENPWLFLCLFLGSFIMIALCWLILLFSKILFKEYFTNRYWKAAFITMTAYPSLVMILLCSFEAYNGLPSFIYDHEGEIMMTMPGVAGLNLDFFPFFAAFTVVYLIHFFVRLARLKKQPLPAAENRGGGDVPWNI